MHFNTGSHWTSVKCHKYWILKVKFLNSKHTFVLQSIPCTWVFFSAPRAVLQPVHMFLSSATDWQLLMWRFLFLSKVSISSLVELLTEEGNGSKEDGLKLIKFLFIVHVPQSMRRSCRDLWSSYEANITRLNKIAAFVQTNLLKPQNPHMGENGYTTS